MELFENLVEKPGKKRKSGNQDLFSKISGFPDFFFRTQHAPSFRTLKKTSKFSKKVRKSKFFHKKKSEISLRYQGMKINRKYGI